MLGLNGGRAFESTYQKPICGVFNMYTAVPIRDVAVGHGSKSQLKVKPTTEFQLSFRAGGWAIGLKFKEAEP